MIMYCALCQTQMVKDREPFGWQCPNCDRPHDCVTATWCSGDSSKPCAVNAGRRA